MALPLVQSETARSATLPIAASVAASTVVRPNPGTLLSLTVTTSAADVLTVYDTSGATATGTVLGVVAAAVAVGTIYSWPLGQPAAQGILAVSSASSPAVTITFS